MNVWEDNWDDDAVEDDFSVQLRYIFLTFYQKLDILIFWKPNVSMVKCKYESLFYSTYSRKRPHSHSPPLRSPEPLAKKMCSRATPPPSPLRSSTNTNGRNGINGHSNGNSVSASEPKTQEPEQQESSETTTSSRGGRRRTSRRGGAGDNTKEDSEPRTPPPPTRSSKRLSRK